MKTALFRESIASACQFFVMMMDADMVAECSVPPGAPSQIDIVGMGFCQLGHLAREFADDW